MPGHALEKSGVLPEQHATCRCIWPKVIFQIKNEEYKDSKVYFFRVTALLRDNQEYQGKTLEILNGRLWSAEVYPPPDHTWTYFSFNREQGITFRAGSACSTYNLRFELHSWEDGENGVLDQVVDVVDAGPIHVVLDNLRPCDIWLEQG